jgi:hypothetical protein
MVPPRSPPWRGDSVGFHHHDLRVGLLHDGKARPWACDDLESIIAAPPSFLHDVVSPPNIDLAAAAVLPLHIGGNTGSPPLWR